MPKVLFLVICLLGFQSQAFENRFSVNNNPDVTWTDISVGQFDHQYNSFLRNDSINHDSVQGKQVEVAIRQAISESSDFEVGTTIQSRQFYSENSYQKRAVVEVSAISMGYKKSFFYEPMTLNLGLNGQLNLGAKALEFASGQSFVEPWVGNEFYVGKYAMGTRASFVAYNRPKPGVESIGRSVSYKGIGFIDIPLFQKVDVGVSAGLFYNDSSMARPIISKPGYVSELNVRYKLAADTEISGAIQSNNDLVEDAFSTQWTVGLSRAL